MLLLQQLDMKGGNHIVTLRQADCGRIGLNLPNMRHLAGDIANAAACEQEGPR